MFSDTSSCPKVYLERDNYREAVSISGDTGLIGKKRTVSLDQYEFRGLTEGAADSIATYKQDTVTDAKAVRMGEPNMWKVVVTTTTYGSWA